jgi:DNA polymerase elongation subunit (family B)
MTSQPKKRIICTKSFRLFDFQVYDESAPVDEESEGDSGKREPPKFMIQMFGVNETGETCSIVLNDYKPFFYAKVSDRWTDADANALYLELLKVKGASSGLASCELVQHKKLYGFSAGKEHKFVKLSFRNTYAFNTIKRLWYIQDRFGNNVLSKYMFKGTKLEIYESNIPPLLRYFHINNISPSGWVQIFVSKAQTPTTPNTTCDFEYICSTSAIKSLPDKETRVPFKICSFDIEASSSHGDFPLPKKSYKRLASNIVDVYPKYKPNGVDKSSALLTLIIMAAFGHGSFDNIDLVYPKRKPEKVEVERMINMLLSSSIKDAEKMASSEAMSVMTISKMFDQMREDTTGCGSGEGDDSDGDNDGDEPQIHFYKKKPKTPALTSKTTIIDVLENSDYDREQKVNFIDTAMVSIFPALEGDKVTFVGSTFMKYGEPEPYLNHCLVLGTCDPVPNVVIESTKNEQELLLKWTDLIQQENPDIIIGYNIFGFDYEFMFRRAEENRCATEFLMLSRNRGDMCGKTSKTGELSIENAKVALASGEYDLRYFKTAGRLQIDMYTYFRRDFNLSSYKLDDVAGQYIGDDIKKIVLGTHAVHGDTTELYSRNLTGLSVNDFIHVEITGFTSDYYGDGKKLKVIDILPDGIIVVLGHHNIEIGKSVKWGMAKDDVTPQDIFRLANGSAADRAIVAKYCIQDCNLVHHLMNKIDVITGYVEMSRICSVPISFLVFRGQGIKLTSYVAKKCREKNTLMPDLDRNGGNEGYEGAIVLPPKCAMYMDNPVACVDYASLYPSSMISQNYSHDSKVWTKEYDLTGALIGETGEKDPGTGLYIYDNLPGYEYIDIEFDTFLYVRKTPTSRAEKVKSGTMMCRWAQLPDDQKSIMPAILEELLSARAQTRKMIKTEKDPFMQNILDKRQLGYKVTANSLYGQCGAKTSTFYEKDVAASTTATGRMMIIYAKRMIEEVYGNMEYETAEHGIVLTKAEYVYGDSVANYTPVYVRVHGSEFDICTIENLAEKYGNGNWVRCVEEGKQEKEFCELSGVETWTESGWTRLHRVIRHALADHKSMWRIQTPTGLVDVTDDHSLLTPSGKEVSPKDVVVGTELLHCRCPDFKKSSINLTEDVMNVSHVDAAIIYNYVSGSGSVEIMPGESPDRVNLRIDTSRVPNAGTQIVSMTQLPKYTGFVYDLTTENHHFAAGIGNMVVHNTDSVFFTFNLQDPKTGENIRGKKALEVTIEIAQDVAHLCSSFLKAPMELTYEKTLMPFVLLSKKRYVGMLYETDANKGKLKYMGLSLKRRDACDYLKDTYGGILNILMKENNVERAIDFLDKSLNDLIEGNVPMEKLMITRALRSDYKNPNQIAHKVLADRIAERDPGNKPKPGDRIKYVFVITNKTKALMGERIETPEFINSEGLKIDYTHYITNQLMKPLQQLFGLAVESIWEHQRKPGAIKTFKKEMVAMEKEFGGDWEVYMKKREKYCSAKVKTLLFDKVLNRISNEKNKIQTITSFFG